MSQAFEPSELNRCVDDPMAAARTLGRVRRTADLWKRWNEFPLHPVERNGYIIGPHVIPLRNRFREW